MLRSMCMISVNGKLINRLINLCTRNDLIITCKNKTENSCDFIISSHDKDLFCEYITKLNMDYSVMKEYGICTWLKKYKTRLWIPFCLFFLLFSIWMFSKYVWNITIYGTNQYTAEQIKQYVMDEYVAIGTKKSEIDCSALEDALREHYDEIAWISCELSGTMLKIDVLETIPQNYNQASKSPSNLIASKDCIVSNIITTNGYQMVEQGMEVKKGDILITGVVPIYNEYDELIETNYTYASGEIYGIVSYDYSDCFALQSYEKTYTEEKRSYGIDLGNIQINLPSKKYTNSDVTTEYKQLKIGNSFYLPVKLRTKIQKLYTTEALVLNEEEAMEKARKKLYYHISQMQKKGVEILENNVKIQISDGQCIATGTILVKEYICILVPIDNTLQGE
ncbi:MAG: sporulation protein YqfD [Eubacteriales bacterium]|nr:sporulation protein YqfD [Lachnospiraceae bacterium]MDO5127203.1 sporulation protein YqfD [Eubacteriales bacterium]